MKRLVVGISGASCAIYGVRALLLLKSVDVETHLVISKGAESIIRHETSFSTDYLKSLASFVHEPDDMGACISSGSFRTSGMLVIPCSVGMMSKIAAGLCSDLISRAASVTIKELNRLVLVVRESPLHSVHLKNMLSLSRMGVVLMPPVPTLYFGEESLEDVIDNSIYRALKFFDIFPENFKEWKGCK